MKLKCPNKECLYEWDYHGTHLFYATCPRCLYKVKIIMSEKEIVKQLDNPDTSKEEIKYLAELLLKVKNA